MNRRFEKCRCLDLLADYQAIAHDGREPDDKVKATCKAALSRWRHKAGNWRGMSDGSDPTPILLQLGFKRLRIMRSKVAPGARGS